MLCYSTAKLTHVADFAAGSTPGYDVDIAQLADNVPVCEIWPGWRTQIPSTALPNDSALSNTRLGTAEVFGGSPERGCIPAAERLGPFGHTSGSNIKYKDHPPWDSLQWGKLQTECHNYYRTDSRPRTQPLKLQRAPENAEDVFTNREQDLASTGRQAVVLRAWSDYVWSDNQLAWVRNLITELSLDTGGQYQVFILLDVHDHDADLERDEIYTRCVASVPAELRDITLPYNERLLRAWFPKVGMYTFQHQAYQAVQLFSHSFPEFDYIWQIEMDARFTGNAATLLSTAADWARKQPRKYLWERNARWYIPALWNNNYTAYSEQMNTNIHECIEI